MTTLWLYILVAAIFAWSVYRIYRSFPWRWVRPLAPETRPQLLTGTIKQDVSFQQGRLGIQIDSQNQEITFDNCHLSNRFWTFNTTPSFTCSVADVLDVYHVPSHARRSTRVIGYLTTIVTAHGKANIYAKKDSADEAQLKKIRDSLAKMSATTPSGGFINSPGFIVAIVLPAGAVVLFLIMWFFDGK